MSLESYDVIFFMRVTQLLKFRIIWFLGSLDKIWRRVWILCHKFSKTTGEIVCSFPDKMSILSAATSPSCMAKTRTICSLCCEYQDMSSSEFGQQRCFFLGGGGVESFLLLWNTCQTTPISRQIIGSNCLKTLVLFLYVENGERQNLGISFLLTSLHFIRLLTVTLKESVNQFQQDTRCYIALYKLCLEPKIF